MMARAAPPDATLTMTASAVAMKRALPSPQPARNPMISLMLPDDPAAALKSTIRARPQSSVHFEPSRLETAPVTSMAAPVTRR